MKFNNHFGSNHLSNHIGRSNRVSIKLPNEFNSDLKPPIMTNPNNFIRANEIHVRKSSLKRPK